RAVPVGGATGLPVHPPPFPFRSSPMRSASRIPGLAMMAAGFLLLLGSTRADEKPVVVKIGGLKATAPAGGKSEEPKYTLRAYQFKLPGKDRPDPELTL